MSKGKKGEGKAAETHSLLQQTQEEYEFTKPTRTNTPDDGVDFTIHSTKKELQNISNQALGRDEFSSLPEGDVSLRQDHKETKHKIGKAAAKKFVDDIEKNKKHDGHVLSGGQGLTSGAKEELDKAKSEGNSVSYLSSDDLNDINNHCRNIINNEV